MLMKPEFEISPTVKEILEESEAKDLTISLSATGNWRGFTFKPTVAVGKPRSTDGFTEHQVGDYKVHLYNKAEIESKIYIDALDLGFFKKFSVTGIVA